MIKFKIYIKAFTQLWLRPYGWNELVELREETSTPWKPTHAVCPPRSPHGMSRNRCLNTRGERSTNWATVAPHYDYGREHLLLG